MIAHSAIRAPNVNISESEIPVPTMYRDDICRSWNIGLDKLKMMTSKVSRLLAWLTTTDLLQHYVYRKPRNTTTIMRRSTITPVHTTSSEDGADILKYKKDEIANQEF